VISSKAEGTKGEANPRLSLNPALHIASVSARNGPPDAHPRLALMVATVVRGDRGNRNRYGGPRASTSKRESRKAHPL
jgi:hypothetical protein